MKRGEILYPHAFTLAAVMHRLGNVSLRDISVWLDGDGPDRRSYNQIINNMQKRGYVTHSIDETKTYNERMRWTLTDTGREILVESERYYKFALACLGGERNRVVDRAEDGKDSVSPF